MTTLTAAPTADSSQLDRNRLATSVRAFGLLLGLAGAVLAALLSIRVGSIDISNRDAWNAIFNCHADSYNETVVRTLRLPRTVIAIAVGGGLAIAGALQISS